VSARGECPMAAGGADRRWARLRAVDVKGDPPNLPLALPDFDPERLLPWVEGIAAPNHILAERHFRRGEGADLTWLLHDLSDPPIDEVGALSLDDFLPKSERKALAAAMDVSTALPAAVMRQAKTWHRNVSDVYDCLCYSSQEGYSAGRHGRNVWNV